MFENTKQKGIIHLLLMTIFLFHPKVSTVLIYLY
jgi:hypothetical protein